MLIVSIKTSASELSKELNLSFVKEMFCFSQLSTNLFNISTNKFLSSYGEDTNAPGLPLIPIDVKVPYGSTINSYNIGMEKELLYNDIVIAPNPQLTSDDITTAENTDITTPNYTQNKFPLQNVAYSSVSNADDSTILHFVVCPFVYECNTKKLYLVTNLKLTINVNTANVLSKLERQIAFINSQLPLFAQSSNVGLSDGKTSVDSLDYVIITNKALMSAFTPLLQWKTQKGVKSNIVTTEEISNMYSNNSLQEKIKEHIMNLYYTRGVKYVLLGGDDTIVPVVQCYMSIYGESANIPSDLYYATLDLNKPLSWDNNGNGIYGEPTDDISLYPNVYVTRLPVRTTEDVNNVIQKIIGYEKEPCINRWNNEILMAGVHRSKDAYDTKSDSEATTDIMYKDYIAPYWTGTRKKMFDSHSDFAADGKYNVTAKTLQDRFKEGFAFVSVSSHGLENSWTLQNGLYTVTEANNLQASRYTIVTTLACNTNEFDSNTDPCLSESFIRNPNNGIVAYWGSSRAGWRYNNEYANLGPTQQYEANFYKRLFTDSDENKNFGKIAALAKAESIGVCKRNDCPRWSMFAINPIGDPEMPVYTCEPKTIDRYLINYDMSKCNLTINIGIKGCTICVMSSKDNGTSYYKIQKNTENAIFTNVTKDVTICITKQNYIPMICTYKVKPGFLGSNIIEKVDINKNGNINVSTKLADNVKDATIYISNQSGTEKKIFNVSAESPVISYVGNTLEKRPYIVSLFVDGKLSDSKSVIVK